jgi:hypothetical protein
MRSMNRMSVAAFGMSAIFALGVHPDNGQIQLVPAVRAESGADAPEVVGCSVARLKGSYGFTTTGSILAFGPVGLVADVGVLAFDGFGGVYQTETLSLNGDISKRSGQGIYSVDRDCTGDMSITVPLPTGETTTLTSDFVIVDEGKEIRFIVTGRGRVLTTVARRQ